MGKKELKSRENWQQQGGIKALQAENNLYDVFHFYFMGTKYHIAYMKNQNT